jgi:hypothetical protein
MELRTLTREELMDFLTYGVPFPESALTNDSTLSFYFTELIAFINLADNIYDAKKTDKYEITVSFGFAEYLVLRKTDDKLALFMSQGIADDIDNITPEEAESVIGLVYGLVVYNEKWREISELADQLLKDPSLIKNVIGGGAPMKINSIEMNNLKDFIKKNKKYY